MDVLDCFVERVRKLLKIFLIQKDLVLLILFLTDPLALGDRDVEVLFGFCGLHIKEVRSFSGTDAPRKYFVLILWFQSIPP